MVLVEVVSSHGPCVAVSSRGPRCGLLNPYGHSCSLANVLLLVCQSAECSTGSREGPALCVSEALAGSGSP